MQKTRLGISVGLLGAAIFLAGFFSGYIPAIILTGYVLLFEENVWLRKASVKAVSLMFVFSLLSVFVGFIPDAIGLINNICHIFNGNFYIEFIAELVSVIRSVLDILEKILFVALGIKALTQGTIRIPVVDDLIKKHMN